MIITFDSAKNLRTKWIEHLLSGKFEQTQEELANEDYTAFCCLGVAEETVGNLLPEEHKIFRTGYGIYGQVNLDFRALHECNEDCPEDCEDSYDDWCDEPENIESDGNLHQDLREAMGLSDEQERILITLNDSAGCDFKGIAAVASEMNFYINGENYDRYGNKLSSGAR